MIKKYLWVAILFVLVCDLVMAILFAGKIIKQSDKPTVVVNPSKPDATLPTVPLNQFKNSDGSWKQYDGGGKD